MSHTHDDEVHEHDLGLQHDLGTLRKRRLGRRGMIGLFGGLGVAAVAAGCGADPSGTATTADTSTGQPTPPAGGMGGDSGVSVADGEIPEETAGPYPGDGSNGPNLLTESGVVRSDITTSFGSASGVAAGIPLTVRFRVFDLTGEDASILAGAAVYAWHCDSAGNYSMYDGDAVNQNYLRGVQETGDDGWLEFTTIFPGCYAGRWPHVHFEVYESLDTATSASNKLRTSQLAFPQDVCEQVYATSGYAPSVANLAGISLESDMVFSDGYSLQMAKMTGSLADGFVATLSVPI
ncbi:MAG: intradiol ring-cleavage dioxygenase [Nocardioides sp.]|uniref:intradiol ring-cleavage dioxygenase n=1 Tax=Nocardioides sp. TaxID=35761 RepID=UPI0032631FE8